ncbi:hypothetical protein CYMTET_12261, partial [Cymbomonas tetramitiformis]
AWNHWPIHASTYLADIINKLGFNDSFSISDCGDLHDLIRAEAATSEVEAAAMGLNASVDVENRCGTEIYDHVIEAIHAGMLAESTLNTSVARVLRHKFSAGLFDKPYQSEKGLVEMRSPRHLQLSLEAAQQGVVVLKNAPLAAARDAILPLDLEKFAGRTIAVIGPLGACTEGSPQAGKYCALPNGCEASCALLGKTFQPLATDSRVATLVEVLQEAAAQMAAHGRAPQIEYARGSNVDNVTGHGLNLTMLQTAVDLAARADLIILAVGDSVHSCSEGYGPAQIEEGAGGGGDRDSLELSSGQQELLEAVTQAKRSKAPLVVALVHGRPITFGKDNHLLDGIDALVSAGRGGEFASRGLLDVLTGRAEPSGRLSNSWPRNVGQVGGPGASALHQVVGNWGPSTLQYKRSYFFSDASPLFAFGFGLAYTSFSLVEATVTSSQQAGSLKQLLAANSLLATVSTTVVNQGARGGYVIVQVYAHDPPGVGVIRYYRRLVGFTKAYMDPGQTKAVFVNITADAISFTSRPPEYARQIFPGSYRFFVSQNANDPSAIEVMMNVTKSVA